MKRPAIVFAVLCAAVLIARLSHAGIVWVEEAYPAAAALQLLHGKTIYRDFWFDKPPLTAWLYLLWGAEDGFPLRVAGAVFVALCCWAAYRFASRIWSPREGITAAVLLAFFLTFDFPAAVMALAPDFVTVLPHFIAVYLAWRRRAFWSGAVAGVAMLVNPKALLILAACALWCWPRWLSLIAGFAAVNGIGIVWLAATGSLDAYYRQVWEWGRIYSRDTFVDRPMTEGVRRTLSWMWFHATIVAAAGWYAWCERTSERLRFALWVAISFAGVVLGQRFFPRYYFLLLPAVLIPAARGLCVANRRVRTAMLLLLAVPLIRFGPRYATFAYDGIARRETNWSDIAMNRDSQSAAAIVKRAAQPGDTLLVWGYRPDIFVYTRMAAGTPFLDSQPLTGVIADRHLTQSRASAPELAAANRAQLLRYRPTFIVDGLGPYNPALAISSYRDLADWLSAYEVLDRTPQSVIYRLTGRSSTPAASPGTP